MDDLQRLRVWLCEQKKKRLLNALAEQVSVDRRTIQRIINRSDYHPRFDTFQLLKDAMDRNGKSIRRSTKAVTAL